MAPFSYALPLQLQILPWKYLAREPEIHSQTCPFHSMSKWSQGGTKTKGFHTQRNTINLCIPKQNLELNLAPGKETICQAHPLTDMKLFLTLETRLKRFLQIIFYY